MEFGNTEKRGGKFKSFKRVNIVGRENISTSVEGFVSKKVVGDVVIGKDGEIHDRRGTTRHGVNSKRIKKRTT